MPRKRTQPGSGCVIERPSKRHGRVFQIRWRINDGPWSSEMIGPDKAEAEEALALRLAEINRGTYRERPQATFHEFASDWFAGHRSRLRVSTADRVRNDLECHLVPFFGDYTVDQITPALVERYIAAKVDERRSGDARVSELEAELARRQEVDELTAEVRKALRVAKLERGLSNVSINKTLTLLRQVLSAAVRDDYITRNPVDFVRRLKTPKKTKPFLQLDQVDVLVEATAPRYQPLVLTLLLAGLRIGEALALRWQDVDLLSDPPRINVMRNWDPASVDPATGKRGIEGPVKTGEEGSVTIGQRLLTTLLDHKARSEFASETDLVFGTSNGRHDNPTNVRQRVLAPAVAKANEALVLAGRQTIPALTPHALRHTYCSLLISQGEDLATVAAQMRHADPSTTLRIYTHVMKHRRSGVAERLDAAIWGDSPARSGAYLVPKTPFDGVAPKSAQKKTAL